MNTKMLYMAGQETTMWLIANGTLLLLQHSHQLEILRQQPGLMPSAIEEILRFDGPVSYVLRVALDDIHLGSCTVPRGDTIAILVDAANRDPLYVDRPDEFDITRGRADHLEFGGGVHFCLGAQLARAEGEVALEAIMNRLPGLRLAQGPIEWSDNHRLRGPVELFVEWDAPARRGR